MKPPGGHELLGVAVVEGDGLVLLGLGALHVGGVFYLLGPGDHFQTDRELFHNIELTCKNIFSILQLIQ